MFIKKDTRKIPDILADDQDLREELNLGRRSSEFAANGIRVVCSQRNVPRLQNLARMSLYDNMLTSAKGIGALSGTPLKELNLGRNQLRTLPGELGKVSTLEKLWVDDNALQAFPESILQLRHLQELRLSGNQIPEIPDGISSLSDLRVLAVDNNGLRKVPPSVGRLNKLESLLLRQNEIEELPAELGSLLSLKTLGVSSNCLEGLPLQIGDLVLLERIFVNGNKLSALPASLARLHKLNKVNLANNRILSLPLDLELAWGRPDPTSGRLAGGSVMPEGGVIVLGNAKLLLAAKQELAAGVEGGQQAGGAPMDESS